MSTQKGGQQGGRGGGKPNNGSKPNNNQNQPPKQQSQQQPQPQSKPSHQQQPQPQPQPRQSQQQPQQPKQQPQPQPQPKQSQQQPQQPKQPESIKQETPETTSTPTSTQPLPFCPLLVPGKFSTVKSTTVTTNIFSTTLDPKLLSAVYQYSVAFDPPIPSAHQKRKQFYNFALLRPSSALEWLAYDGEGLSYSFLSYENVTLSYNDLVTEALKADDVYDEFGTKVTTLLSSDQKITITMTNKCLLGGALEEFKKTTSTHQAIVDAFGSINNGHKQQQLASSDTLRLKNELVSFVNLSLSTLLRHCSVAFACHSERNRIRAIIMNKYKLTKEVVEKARILLSIEGFIARNGVVYRLDRPDSSYNHPLGNGLYAIHSSFSALRFLQKGISFVVDLSATPCYKLGESIINILKEILGTDRNGVPIDLKTAPQSIYNQLSKYRAITTHLPPDKNQRVALHKVGPKLKDCSFIDKDTGKQIKVIDYFKKQYNITCNPEYYTYVVEKTFKPKMDPKTNQPFPNQPKAGTIIQHHFPIEVLSLYSMNNNGAKDLNTTQTKAMLELMTQRPNTSLKTIHEQLTLLQTAIKYMAQQTTGSAALVINKNDKDYATLASKSIYNGITISTTAQTAKARVLPPPSAQFGGVVVPGQSGEFKVPPKHTFIQPASTTTGTIKVVLANLTRCSETDKFANAVITMSAQRGLKLQLDTTEPMFDVQQKRQPKDLELWCDQIYQKSVKNKTPYLVLAICQANSPLYDLLKRKCDFHLGLITQCADASKVMKNLRQEYSTASYVGNIILKINSKLGGLNYLLQSQKPEHNPLLSNAVKTASTTSLHPTLSKTVPIACFGIDVFHNPSKRSHAGVVCSFNQQLTHYNGYLIQQPKTAKIGKEQKAQEMIGTETLQKAFHQLLLQFAQCQSTPSLPSHLVIYRDGLSESQMSISMDIEIPGIIAAAQEAYLTLFPTSTYKYNPTITFLIAVKRHHVILVPADGEDDPIGNKGQRTQNVRAGTVIDTDIVRNDVPEFYLQAHASALGTGKSTCYQVVYCSDAQRVSMDDIQLLTNYLSYNHQRAYKATRIPSTVAFADLLCYRGRLFQRESAQNQDGSWDKDALPENMMKKHFWL